MSIGALPKSPGTYILFIRLEDAFTLSVGRLGSFDLAAGMVAYVGSAHGPGGLNARISRHCRPDKLPHWHIDALTTAAPVTAVWFSTSPERLECAWAIILAALDGVRLPVSGFGSSDCTCRTHLFTLPHAVIPTAWQALNRPFVIRV
jgi:Uri superfamily endonuclease